MTKKKKWSYIVVGILFLIILWLLTRGSSATAQPNSETVNIPAFNLPPKQSIVVPPYGGFPPINVSFPPVSIPGLPADNLTNYNMRSACACGGSTIPYYLTQQAPPPPPPPPITYPPVTQPVVNSYLVAPSQPVNPYDPSGSAGYGWLDFGA